MELGYFLALSGLTDAEVSSKVFHDSLCQMGNSVLLSWVIYYEAFYLHVLSSFSCIPVIFSNFGVILNSFTTLRMLLLYSLRNNFLTLQS